VGGVHESASADVFLFLYLTVSFFCPFRNKDQKSQDYSEMEKAYRPSHADATYDFKYGIRAVAGGGRSSARETIGRVAAGAIAKKLLKTVAGCEVFAYVSRVRDVESNVDHSELTMEAIESNPVRCPDQEAADLMYKAIDEVRTRGESCGGEVTIVVKNCPKGLGAPVFDKLEAEMAKALMSLPATKGFEIGSGFSGSKMLGSEHNDEFYIEDGKVRTRTNRSGGVQGGISNGEDIVMKIAFKPTAVRSIESTRMPERLTRSPDTHVFCRLLFDRPLPGSKRRSTGTTRRSTCWQGAGTIRVWYRVRSPWRRR